MSYLTTTVTDGVMLMTIDRPPVNAVNVELLTEICSQLEAVAAALNSRPRKTLGWKTPAEALNEHLLLAQQGSVATTG